MAKIDNEQRSSAVLPLLKLIKVFAGSVLMVLMPSRRQRVQRLATIPWHEQQEPDAFERLIRVAMLWWRSRDSSGAQLADLHQEFWRTQSSESYYAGTQNRFEKVFLPHFDHYLDQLSSMVNAHHCDCLIEIGCGDGQLLRHLQQRVPLKRFVGIDLSEDQIAHNLAERADDGPEYYAADASLWIKQNAPNNACYVTGLGVLEYFTQTQLSDLLTTICQQRPPACALFIEPVDANADFDSFDASYPAGEEHSFTHHYENRLQQSGWSVEHCEEVKLDAYRWLVIMASCEGT